MNIKSALAVFFLVVLAGCGTKYTYTHLDKVYDDDDDFKEAVMVGNAKTKRAILPLPKPLSAKKLIIVSPSVEVFASASMAREQKRLSRNLKSSETEMLQNIAWSNFEAVKTDYEVTQIRGIYSHVSFRESNTLTNALAPAADYDTLVWYEEAAGRGQWFYSSSKFGRQIFVWDSTSKDQEVNINSYLSALEALAIRE